MVRIEESKRLLANTDYSVVDIAVATGFIGWELFFQGFQKIHGTDTETVPVRHRRSINSVLCGILLLKLFKPIEILSRIIYNIRDKKEASNMANSYSKQIQDQIKAAAEGTIFISSDFADIADTETIRRNLNRLTQAGMLRRILKGVYEKPKYSKLLDEYWRQTRKRWRRHWHEVITGRLPHVGIQH